ncbi:hypothetical protein R1sor_003880 [Riccia sorocarpa]|uniref:Uncharacterized protein n=1 Tax=Riccia sorocarpa TaxID=122646 RepID=A0ABD3H396_9MARC
MKTPVIPTHSLIEAGEWLDHPGSIEGPITIRATIVGFGHHGTALMQGALYAQSPSGVLRAGFITAMSLEDFEVVHLRGDRSDILNRCIGRQWMFQLTRIQNNRAPYAGVEHVEAVFKKELFPDPEDGGGVMNEAVGLRHRVF